MKNTDKHKHSKVDEPEIQNQQKEFAGYNSYEDENNATAELAARRTPEENFKLAHEMIKAMYKKELENMPDPPYSRITFTIIDGLPV